MKRQRGFATIVVIVVAALAVAGVGYVLLSRNGVVPAVPGLGGVTLNDKCKYNDKDLCKFLNNFKTTSNYTVAGSSTAKDGTKSTFTFKLSGNDKFQDIISTNGTESYNAIVIGDDTYTKDQTDGKWVKTTATKDDKSVKDDIAFNDDVDDTAKPEDDPKYTKVGTEACGKRTCFKYQVAYPGAEGTSYIWFDSKDYLLRKTQDTATDGSVTTTEYSYDKVNISVPSPIKEAAAASASPTAADLQSAAAAAAAAGFNMDTSTETDTQE